MSEINISEPNIKPKHVMQVIYNESPWEVDVDQTLILWGHPEATVSVLCPYLGDEYLVTRHKQNIQLLKEKFLRGCHITVHSQGGARWAEAVVTALGIQDYVHVCKGKPVGSIDDLPAKKWYPKNTWISTEDAWKKD